MNRFSILLFAFLFLGTGCRSEQTDNQLTVDAFRKNHHNFKLTKKYNFKNISFKLSPFFERSFANYFMISSKGQAYKSTIIPVYFSVERFAENDRYESFLTNTIAHADFLNTLHDAYVKKRYTSLQNGAISIKKKVRSNVHFDGVIQTIAGASSITSTTNYYLTATLRINDSFYVFQFIADPAIMSYLYDDFERILATVKPIR